MPPFLDTLIELKGKVTNSIGIRFESWPLLIAGLILLITAYVYMPDTVTLALSLSLFLAPVWLPFLLMGGAKSIWYVLKRSEFIANQKYILLEIKPPRNLVKTPLAMETFLSSIHFTGGEATWYDRFRGGVRPSFSLEIASFEGQVHFFIWTRAAFRRSVEGQLYAQYPGVQKEKPRITRDSFLPYPRSGVSGGVILSIPQLYHYQLKPILNLGSIKCKRSRSKLTRSRNL